jgi:hypothetical protein
VRSARTARPNLTLRVAMAMKAVAFQRTAPQRKMSHTIEWLRKPGVKNQHHGGRAPGRRSGMTVSASARALNIRGSTPENGYADLHCVHPTRDATWHRLRTPTS